MTYRLGIRMEIETDDAGDLARALRDIAGWLEEEGVVPGPIVIGGRTVGRISAETSP